MFTEKSKEKEVLKIIICDDEEEQLSEWEQQLKELDLPVDLQVETCADSMKLLELMVNEKHAVPDVIFCDIKMPKLDGILLGKKLQALCPQSYLVFITAYVEYAMKGYEARAFRYLLKPVTAAEFKKVLLAVLREKAKKKKVAIKSAEGESVLLISDITHLSSEDKYTILYTKTGHFVDRISLNDYEELLADYGFFRIHRKYIVNMAYHKGLKKGTLFLTNGTELFISRRKEAAYKAALEKYLEKELL